MRECVIAIGYRGQPNRLVADFISVVNRVSESSRVQVGA
jgi:hypothetical protein